MAKGRVGKSVAPPEVDLLKGLVRAVRSALDLPQMLNLVLDLLINSVKAEVGIVLLRHGERFVPRAALGLTEKVLRDAVCGGRPLWDVLLEQDDVFVCGGEGAEGMGGRLRSVIAAPLINGGERRGLIVLANKVASTEPAVFGPSDAAAMRLLVDDLAVIVDNALLYEEVSHLKSYNESILDSLPNGIVTTDLEGTIVTVNKGAEYILGVEEAACVGQNVATLFRRVLKADFDILRVVRSGENLIDYEVNLEKEDGRILVLGVSVSALRSGGRIIGAAIHISDFTQRKLLEGQMARAEQLAALGEMSAGVAHEIRNPLTSIQGFTQLLPKRKDDPKFLEKYVEIVTRETARLNGIVERFLAFARPRQTGFQPCQVNEIVQNALSLLHYQMERQGVALELRMAETPPVRGDWQQLEQVFINILLNAVQMMDKPEKRLSVSTAVLLRKMMDNRYREFVAVRIADNGPGIPPDRIERIFQPFYTTRPEGTGLGLSITSQIVERHEGAIEVQSKPGEGTVFTVYLPALESGKEEVA